MPIISQLTKLHLLVISIIIFNSVQSVSQNIHSNTQIPYQGIISLVSNPLENPSKLFELEYIDGVKLRIGWKHIERKNNEFNWNIIDKYVSEAKKHNKALSVCIAGGASSPSWLINELSEEEYIHVRGKNVPILWSKKYVNEYVALIKAFGERYATNKYLSHVTVSGIGFGNEPIIPIPTLQVSELNHWSIAALKIIKTYVDYFPGKELSLVVHTQIPRKDTWDFFQTNILDSIYHYSETIGLEFHGLDATASPEENLTTDQYYKEIKRVSPTRVTGYQFVCSTIGNNVCKVEWVNGSSFDSSDLMKKTLMAGIENGADFIEVYPNDIFQKDNIPLFIEASPQLKK